MFTVEWQEQVKLTVFVKIGADFITKEVETDDGKRVMMQLWDTAGQERFQSLGVAYYRGADACILVYDVNNFLSFQHLGKKKWHVSTNWHTLTLWIERWREDFLKQSSLPAEEAKNFPLIIIGNKIDIDDRVVSRRQARAFAEIHSSDKMQIPCFEASAKNGDNVEKAFAQIAKMVKIPQLELDMNDNNSFSLTSDSIKKKSCC